MVERAIDKARARERNSSVNYSNRDAVPTSSESSGLDRRGAMRLVALSTAVTGAAYACSFGPPAAARIAPWLLAIGANALILSLMALGALRRDRLPRVLAWVFGGLFVLCAGAFLLALALPAREGAGGPMLLGLPLRTAIVIYGVGVLPMFVLPFAYAFTFESLNLTEEDLDRVRAAHASLRARGNA